MGAGEREGERDWEGEEETGRERLNCRIEMI